MLNLQLRSKVYVPARVLGQRRGRGVVACVRAKTAPCARAWNASLPSCVCWCCRPSEAFQVAPILPYSLMRAFRRTVEGATADGLPRMGYLFADSSCVVTDVLVPRQKGAGHRHRLRSEGRRQLVDFKEGHPGLRVVGIVRVRESPNLNPLTPDPPTYRALPGQTLSQPQRPLNKPSAPMPLCKGDHPHATSWAHWRSLSHRVNAPWANRVGSQAPPFALT